MSKKTEKNHHELLEKMEHLIEEQPQQPEKKSEPKPQESKPVSRNKALMTYIAVLFGVAFALVLLSLVMQMRDIDRLNQSADNALAKAELLQDENRALSETNQAFQAQMDSLQAEKEAVEQELETEKQTVQNQEKEIASLEEQLTAAGDGSREKETAYELLLTAQEALDREDPAAFRAAMDALASLEEAGLLGERGHALYQELLPAYNMQAEE